VSYVHARFLSVRAILYHISVPSKTNEPENRQGAKNAKNHDFISVLSKIKAPEKRQDAKNAKGDVLIKFSSRPPGS